MMNDGKRVHLRKNDVLFYGVLALCVAVVGISGYALFIAPTAQQTALDDSWAVYVPAEPATEAVTDTTQSTIPVQVPVETVTDAVEITQAEPEVTVDAPVETVEPAMAVQSAWVRPVAGEVIAAYSGEALVFNDTMQDWRVHTGTDYAGEVGERVYVVADGTVQDVYEDGLFGTCVTLSLSNGMTATYKGLSADVKVEVDSIVRAGDVVGTIGDSNYAEAAMEPHLHFELADATGPLDPESVLTE